jgi:sporulation protein YpjB
MNKRLCIFVLIGLVIILSLVAISAWGKEESPAETSYFLQLDDLSQQVVEFTKQGDFEEAKLKLDELAQLFTQIGEEKKISIEALDVATNTIVMGKRSFNRATTDKDQLTWHAHQIRVLIDAITHPNEPIWKSYHTSYLEQIGKMIHLSSRKQQKDLTVALQDNLKLYNILKPAFAVTQNPQTVEVLDSVYTFLLQETRNDIQNWEAMQGSLEQLRQTTDNIFLGKEQFTLSWYISSNSPTVMILLMTSILLTALSYVGYKMYRGAQHTTT